MMTDIFTSFDSAIFAGGKTLPLLWAAPLMLISALLSGMWLSLSSTDFKTSKIVKIMSSQVAETKMNMMPVSQNVLSSLFCLLVVINLWGILPYTFSLTTHLMFTIILGAPLWLGMVISSFTNNPKGFTAALLPGGAPLWLNPFLVYIETMSMMVRPLTLGFRLAANMSAGHIVLTLISIYMTSAMFISLWLTIILLGLNMGYVAFEVGICLIQAFIFTLLLTLYSDDHQ